MKINNTYAFVGNFYYVWFIDLISILVLEPYILHELYFSLWNEEITIVSLREHSRSVFIVHLDDSIDWKHLTSRVDVATEFWVHI
jgi:hypothetical protein